VVFCTILYLQLQVLQSKVSELELRNTELQRQLSLHHEAVGRDEPPREDGSLEEAYIRRDYVDHLVGEVKRLEPCEREVKKLQRQLKHMEEVLADAQKRDQQLCDQVALVSLKEMEIVDLKRQLSAGASELAEIARLKEQLTGKEREIARLKARLKKQERTKSIEEADDDSTGTPPPTAGDIAAIQAEYERKLEHKETMISRLKKRVTALTKAAQHSGQGEGEGTTQDTSEEVEVRATSMAMVSGGVFKLHMHLTTVDFSSIHAYMYT
jgi:predicted RNase H-like nuclease (RuvC/YqgF family)